VVATDVGELARTVREYDLGELYRPGDADDLVRAIGRAIGRYPQLQKQVGDAADALSWETDGRALRDAYVGLQVGPPGVGILSEDQPKPEEGP